MDKDGALKFLGKIIPRSPSDPTGKNEWAQAVARLIIVSIVAVYFVWLDLFFHERSSLDSTTLLILFYLGFSFGIYASFLVRPDAALWRRIITLAGDLSTTVFAVLHAGEPGMLFFGILLWVTMGFGVRFGQRYLLAAAFLAVAELLGLGMLNPYWREHWQLLGGMIITIVAVPLYVSSLLKNIDKARHRAELANKAKTQFLANMSHEIRTPLTGIIGMADLLMKEDLNDHLNEKVNIINVSAKTLLGLLEDTLDISRIEAGKLTLEEGEMDLHEVVNSMALMFRPQAVARGLRFTTRVSPEIPFALVGDSLRLRQVMSNFLGNAIKFTQEGYIRLTVSQISRTDSEVCLRFEVSDSGIGIEPKFQEHIFEQFTQADDSTTRRYGGTGLGMAISRRLVELMQGRIGVNSMPGEGSTFWFEVPLKIQDGVNEQRQMEHYAGVTALLVSSNLPFVHKVRSLLDRWGIGVEVVATAVEAFSQLKKTASGFHAYQLLLVDERSLEISIYEFEKAKHVDVNLRSLPFLVFQEGLDQNVISSEGRCSLSTDFKSPIFFNAIHDMLNHGSLDTVTHLYSVTSPAKEHHWKILVVEDNATVQIVVKTILEKAGHQVALAEDGEQALDILLENEFDIAIVDMQMPGLSGPDLIRAYHYTDSGVEEGMPFLILSANATPEAENEARDAGAGAYLTKPVNATRLLEYISKLMSKQPVAKEISVSEVGRESAVVSDSGGSVFDPEALDDLVKLSGDTSIAWKLKEQFMEDLEKLVPSLRVALRNQDFAAYRDITHALQGSAGGVGAERLAYLARKMCHSKDSEILTQGGYMVCAVEEQMKQVGRKLEEYLQAAGSNRAKH